MAITNYDRRLAARQQVEQLIVMVTTVIASPTPANVDAAITTINNLTTAGTLLLKPNVNLDGESYDWPGYLNTLAQLLRTLDEAVQRARPYFITTRMHP